MSTSYRPTGTSRRTNRGNVHDHDVFEGLPVRRWTKSWVSVGKPSVTHSIAQPELPLPKDTALLSATSQALLAAARSGSDTPTPAPQKPEFTPGEKLFLTKRWVLVPKPDEGPEETYLIRLPGRRKEGNDTGDSVDPGRVVKRVGPPRGGGKKMKGRPGRRKKIVETPAEAPAEAGDVEMVDVDAATAEPPVPQSEVAKEVEKREEEVEKAAVDQIEEGVKRHDLPAEAGTGDVEMGGAPAPAPEVQPAAESNPAPAPAPVPAPAESEEQKPAEGA